MSTTAIHLNALHNTLAQSPTVEGPIFMVASGKGGVGKTWVSICLCQALAQAHKKVLLFDGDLGLANVDIQLGLMPDQDLGTVIAGHATLENIVFKYDVANFDIIAGRSGSDVLTALSPERLLMIRGALKALSTHYESVVIDFGAGIGHTVRTLSHIANVCFVVVTDEPTSLTDAYAFIKLTQTAQPDLPIEIIVNQAEDADAGQRVYETLSRVCDTFLNFTPNLAGIIRRDALVRDAICHQSPMLTRHGRSPAAQDAQRIATYILKKYLR